MLQLQVCKQRWVYPCSIHFAESIFQQLKTSGSSQLLAKSFGSMSSWNCNSIQPAMQHNGSCELHRCNSFQLLEWNQLDMADHCSEKYCISCEIFENHIEKTIRTKHILSILIPYNDVHMAIWTADSRSFPIIISNIYMGTCHSLQTSTMASNRLATSSLTFGGKKCKNQQASMRDS